MIKNINCLDNILFSANPYKVFKLSLAMNRCGEFCQNALFFVFFLYIVEMINIIRE